MKQTILVLMIFVSLTFAQTKNLPDLYASALTNDGSKIYLLGGMTDNAYGSLLKTNLSSLVNDLWKYTPGENSWEDETPSNDTKPEGRYYSSIGSNQSSNSIYLFGGYDDNKLLTDIWIFNLASKKWDKVNQPTTLSERGKYGVVHTNNSFYVIGGATTSDQPIKDNWQYNLTTNTWTKKKDVPFSDTHINGATNVNPSKTFVFKKQGTDKFYIYNEQTDTWREQTTTGTIPVERYNGICVSNGNMVYVGGGYTYTEGKLKDFYELDTESWVWKKLSDLPKELDGPASTAMLNMVYVYGGIDKENKKTDKLYQYNISTNTWSEKSTIVGVRETEKIPTDFVLYQNYPNPFNPSTNIEYELAKDGFVSLKVFDILGSEIATLVEEFKQPGKYTALCTFNSTFSSGIYFYKLKAGNFLQTKKMVYIK